MSGVPELLERKKSVPLLQTTPLQGTWTTTGQWRINGVKGKEKYRRERRSNVGVRVDVRQLKIFSPG